MTDTAELKPCPFCGGKAAYYEDWYCDGIMDAVSCETCPAAVVEVTSYNGGKNTREQLIAAWNTRPVQ